ncbi:MAG: GNAT family N-acetyltransferase [Acidobacteria bacterium]|nr:GNAT family N-acetyltransferase [Acidobacteriota bacterium]
MSQGIQLRPVTDTDLPFLARVYASTRAEELAVVPWSDEQKEQFLNFQFHAQHTYYMDQFKGAAFDVIMVAGKPAGRLYVDRRADEIRLVDIALLPTFRGKGVGSQLIQGLFAEARNLGIPVKIHVEHNNPAMRLYQRLGFTSIDTNGVYMLMEWTPNS